MNDNRHNEINPNDLLKELTFWYNKSDEECIEMATNEYGIDAEQALINMFNRTHMTEASNNLLKSLLIESIKTDDEFAKKWGLTIVERELSLDERYDIMKNGDLNEWITIHYKEPKTMEYMDKHNIPTRLITLIYNNETIKIYK
jgi:hypothetical protein